jgi:hypothetical protein
MTDVFWFGVALSLLGTGWMIGAILD